MPHHRTILVVDDDADNREAMIAFLEGEGYAAEGAEHGEAALRRLRSPDQSVCLILLDLFMPVMNGWEFRSQQLNDPALAALPVVVVSADRGSVEHAATLGAVDSMVKPIDFDRLLETVALHC
jgi:CheY-like chemotaxis protein